jgi:hypothetical protein
MAHYAIIGTKNNVIQVITGVDETEETPNGFVDWEDYYESIYKIKVRRTSYNTINNNHMLDGTPFRGNYARIGYIWDEENEVFYSQKPYDSWVLNTDIWAWEAPIAYPDDTIQYQWNEELQQWENTE